MGFPSARVNISGPSSWNEKVCGQTERWSEASGAGQSEIAVLEASIQNLPVVTPPADPHCQENQTVEGSHRFELQSLHRTAGFVFAFARVESDIKTGESQSLIVHKRHPCKPRQAQFIPQLPTLNQTHVAVAIHLKTRASTHKQPYYVVRNSTTAFSLRVKRKFAHLRLKPGARRLYSHTSYAAFPASLILERNLLSCPQPATMLAEEFEEPILSQPHSHHCGAP